MPPSCTVCQHENVLGIEAELAKKTPIRRIVAKYGASEGSIRRHRENCMKEKMAIAKVNAEKELETSCLPVIQQLRMLQESTLEILRGAKDEYISLKASSEVRKNLELMARLTGEISPNGVTVGVGINLTLETSPEWADVQRRMVEALEPYPEARAAVVAALGV